MIKINKNNKLYSEIKGLCKIIPGNTKLSNHKIQDVIHISLLKLIEKEIEGVVVLEDYNHYRGYMYLIVRNNVFKALNILTKDSKSFYQEIDLDDEHFNLNDNEQYNMDLVIQRDLKIKLTKKYLNELSNINRALVRWSLRGWTYQYISDNICNHGEAYTGQKIRNFIKKIKAGVEQELTLLGRLEY